MTLKLALLDDYGNVLLGGEIYSSLVQRLVDRLSASPAPVHEADIGDLNGDDFFDPSSEVPDAELAH